MGRIGLRTALRGLSCDQSGSILVYATLAMPAILGIAALGAEGSMWLYNQRHAQNAADSAAFSAAAAYAADTTADLTAQARAVSGSYGLIHGQDGVTVQVNRPPVGTCYSGTPRFTGGNAIEVIVTKSQARLFSAEWLGSGNSSACGRAVALVPGAGDCILTLGTTGVTINNPQPAGNNLNLSLSQCNIFSNSSDPHAITISGNNAAISANAVGTFGGIQVDGNNKSFVLNPATGAPREADPFAAAASSWPLTGGAAQTNCGGGTCTLSLSPGTYGSGISLPRPSGGGGGTVTYTFAAGTYYLGNNFAVTGNNITINATAGVTFVMLNSSTFSVTGNSVTFNLTAPTSGTFQGVAIWQPVGNTSQMNLTGQSFVANIAGAIYAPGATIDYEANTTTNGGNCTQLVANALIFGGNSISLKGNCGGGMKTFGQIPALVE